MAEINNKIPQKKKLDVGAAILSILLIIALVIAFIRLSKPSPKVLSYADFVKIIDVKNTNTEITNYNFDRINDKQVKVTGTVKETSNETTSTYEFVVIMASDNYDALEKNAVEHNYKIAIKENEVKNNVWLTILINLGFPIILLGLMLFLMTRANGNGKALEFGKSTARLARGKTVTFRDVAGCDEEKQELEEIVDFLKNPKKYAEIGARVPKGVLLSGNPGTGKTLLARAVAGEAGVSFFSISGSDFVEMFIGVGASRVRDLFKQAKQNAPCIIFIDEIDAVGRQRGAGMGGGHDEREQTLNQLLVEMDGFAANIGIIVMAATNRPDVLDPALLRPGRFDRQITIPLPDVKGREAILKVHARNKKFDSNVKFDEIAHRIPGFSGAEIENLLNEAALLAARANRKVINKFDIDEATDRVLMGPAKKSHKMTEKERDRVAHHEAGHAVIGLKLEHSNVVQKVTIVPRGQAGGYALMLPEEENFLQTEEDLRESITGYLGGRVAEEIVYNSVSSGAQNDFQQATRIARTMVTEFGMSNLGPVQYERQQGSVFLGRDYLKDKNFSDAIAFEIDKEVRRIIEECYEKAREFINENRYLLESIAYYLKEIETLTKQDIDEINETGKLKWYDDQLAAKKAETTTAEEPEVKQDTETSEVETNDENR